MQTDLKNIMPCPFENVEKELGHELYICREEEVSGLPRVGCTCGARGPLACGDDQSVIDSWNKRTSENPLDGMRLRNGD